MFLVLLASLSADEPQPISETEALPFGQRPVDYWKDDAGDPISELQHRLTDQRLELPYVEKFGYLPAILRELDIPVESQLLVFSSQSPHRNVIRPERPRAIYFNDDVSVSWYPGAVLLEIAAHDAQKGTLFFTLVNRQDAAPEFYRGVSQTCLGCHHMPANPSWTGVAVPGHLLRSFLETEEAKSYPFGKILSHALPLEQRWQTWYVTGLSPDQRHRGNLTQTEHQRRKEDDPTYHRPVFDLAEEFDTDRYPTNTSDAVAHLVFDHQMLGLNLLSRLSHEHQFRRRSNVETMAVRYLLLADEAPLNNSLTGKSRYAEWYRHRGPLYELDLETRLYKHRLSPLVNCRMVRGFPPEFKQAFFSRLNDVLTGKAELEGFTLTDRDREETLAVLRETVEGWPGE